VFIVSFSKDSFEIGYAMISEEHSPQQLLRNAQHAEEAGFKFAMLSDHFHPWISRQGNSPFAWSILGALSQTTKQMRFATGVTCPIMRYHPAIIAQAAATVALMMPNRFALGLGTGENLNEHIIGLGWPDFDVRAAMLEEAVKIIRMLWEGGVQTYYGNYFTIENARLFTLPEKAPEILIAASGPNSAELAGEIGDGLITTSPEPEVLNAFRSTLKHTDAPCYAYITACYAEDEDKAKKLVVEQWPNAGLPGELNQELRTFKHFEQAAQLVSEETVTKTVLIGKDSEAHIRKIQQCKELGINKVYIHQIGPDQEGLIKFYKKEIMPHFEQ
jgi:G6PDH family F420-dependent oxidoreductase